MTISAIPINGRTNYRTIRSDGHDGKANATIDIGGIGEKFAPEIRLQKWDDEAWLKIYLPTVVTNQTPSLISDKVQFAVGNNTHRWYEIGTTKIEWEIDVAVKPVGNKFTFQIDYSPGLQFFFQPPLEAWEIAKGNSRPDEVVGSYAVYWNKRYQKYKTGKVAHIYRPKMIDALSDETWCDLDINTTAKTLTITVPQAWLDTATFPTRLDPIIGDDSAGASMDNIGNTITAGLFTAPSSGDANPGTMYAYVDNQGQSGHTVPMAAYGNPTPAGSPRSDPKVSSTVLLTSLTYPAQWESGAITWTGITASTTYWLSLNGDVISDVYIALGYDSGAGTSYYTDREHSDDMPDPWPNSGSSIDYLWSLYVEYSVAGGGGQSPVLDGAILNNQILEGFVVR